ncbi:hypothetical protein [Microbacterium murale]|uniref:DUF402 domain-containing protein n=1 Tax=Microbacterium murale TaxID=1081040 RepID=A0ABU0P6J9_9MICO|nr:hypothetical protein [Microbacterium murale]MDQ0642567.1 hypothetical protein [Microbacterium murale]
MTARPEPGSEMVFQWRKWNGSPHWRHECVYLGADEWGDWVGQPVGWHSIRPGAEFYAAAPNVTLVPPSGDFALTVNRDHPIGMRIYIDLGWDVRWADDPVLATGIDMDLDVIRFERDRDPADGPSGTWVDDRDEWAEHSIRYGYPADVMTHLEALTLDLETRVRAQNAPFDDATADAWLDRLDALQLGRPRLDA